MLGSLPTPLPLLPLPSPLPNSSTVPCIPFSLYLALNGISLYFLHQAEEHAGFTEVLLDILQGDEDVNLRLSSMSPTLS